MNTSRPAVIAREKVFMARLRTMLLALAVAALLLVGAASAALAGITVTRVD